MRETFNLVGTLNGYGGNCLLALFCSCFHVTDAGHYRMLCSPIITVLVGQSQKNFHIHQELLCHHSLFFRHMLRSAQFPESQDNVVKLPEDDVTSFSVFAEYVYIENQCDTSAILEGALSSRENINDEHDESEKSDTPGGESELSHGNDGATNGDNNEENRTTEGNWKNVGNSDHLKEPYTLRDDKHFHGVYDKYDFMLQFTCYVLADKLQALGFKRLIMDEIRCHGEFCKPNNVTMEHIRYVYNNTISPVDPLRRFCIMMRCKKMPLEETLEDPEFLELLENGGPLVRDIMRTCRKQTIKQKEKAKEQEQKVSKQREEIADYEQKVADYEQTIKNHKEEIGRHMNSIEMWKRRHRGLQTPTQ